MLAVVEVSDDAADYFMLIIVVRFLVITLLWFIFVVVLIILHEQLFNTGFIKSFVGAIEVGLGIADVVVRQEVLV